MKGAKRFMCVCERFEQSSGDNSIYNSSYSSILIYYCYGLSST